MKTKICRKCSRELPLTEYYKCVTNKDGYMSYCRKCQNKYCKEYHRRRVERERLKMFGRNEL